jgi:hypothetical protein
MVHEMEEETIANGVIAWLSFFVFCLAGYLTGTYFPVIKPLQCIVLVWNPFYYQPEYLTLLKNVRRPPFTHPSDLSPLPPSPLLSQAIDSYAKKLQIQQSSPDAISSGSEPSGPRNRKGKKEKTLTSPLPPSRSPAPDTPPPPQTLSVDAVFKSNFFLRFAKSNPKEYLRVLGLFFVITEMISVLTPSVAVGIQWMAALCPGTAKQAILGLIEIGIKCSINGDCENAEHCLLLPHK